MLKASQSEHKQTQAFNGAKLISKEDLDGQASLVGPNADILCSECESKQLQQSEGVESQYSLRVSQLGANLNNKNYKRRDASNDSYENRALLYYSQLNSKPQEMNLVASENDSIQSNSILQAHHLVQTKPQLLASQSNSSLDFQSVSSLKYVSALAPSNLSRAATDSKEASAKISTDDLLSKGVTTNSLQYLSYLSQNVAEQTKIRNIQNDVKYATNSNLVQHSDLLRNGLEANLKAKYEHLDSTRSSYKDALRNFMDKKLQRDLKYATGSISSTQTTTPQSIQMSRVFRERQSRRVFEELQQLKSSCARTYEELEAMHTEVLMGKGKFNNLN